MSSSISKQAILLKKKKSSHHAIVHNVVPIFAGHTPEEDYQRLLAGPKVYVLRHSLPILHHPEQDHSGVGVKQDQQKHGGNDETTSDHAHYHRQHQHFQRRLPAYIFVINMKFFLSTIAAKTTINL